MFDIKSHSLEWLFSFPRNILYGKNIFTIFDSSNNKILVTMKSILTEWFIDEQSEITNENGVKDFTIADRTGGGFLSVWRGINDCKKEEAEEIAEFIVDAPLAFQYLMVAYEAGALDSLMSEEEMTDIKNMYDKHY